MMKKQHILGISLAAIAILLTIAIASCMHTSADGGNEPTTASAKNIVEATTTEAESTSKESSELPSETSTIKETTSESTDEVSEEAASETSLEETEITSEDASSEMETILETSATETESTAQETTQETAPATTTTVPVTTTAPVQETTTPPATTGHTHSHKESSRQEATCDKDGFVKYTCSCGDSYQTTLSAKGHSYENKAVAPTYDAEGYTLHTCRTCGHSYKDSFVAKLTKPTETDAPETWGPWQEGAWTVTDRPSCSDAGTEERILTRTSSKGRTETKKETRAVAPLGHKMQVRYVKEPTETERGWTEYECTRCDHTHREYKDKITWSEWKAGNWVTIKAAACESKGSEERTLTRTSNYGKTETKKETRETAALGHDYKSSVVPPTADAEGYTLHTCLRCGHSYKDSFVPKLETWGDWKWSAWKVTKQPTCCDAGTEERTGTRTSSLGRTETKSETRSVTALGHDWKTETVTVTKDVPHTKYRLKITIAIWFGDGKGNKVTKEQLAEHGLTNYFCMGHWWEYPDEKRAEIIDGFPDVSYAVRDATGSKGSHIAVSPDGKYTLDLRKHYELGWGMSSYGYSEDRIDKETYYLKETITEEVTTCTRCGAHP